MPTIHPYETAENLQDTSDLTIVHNTIRDALGIDRYSPRAQTLGRLIGAIKFKGALVIDRLDDNVPRVIFPYAVALRGSSATFYAYQGSGETPEPIQFAVDDLNNCEEVKMPTDAAIPTLPLVSLDDTARQV